MADNNKLVHRQPPALPAGTKAGDGQLKTSVQRNINDMVHDIHKMLVNADDPDSEAYSKYLWATWDEQAVEGSLSIDNSKAAEMIRNRGKKLDPSHPLVSEKLATIVKALGVVLRRYGQDRRHRRNMVDGEYVPDNADNERS